MNALIAEPLKIAGPQLLDFIAGVENFAAEFDLDIPLQPLARKGS